MEINNDKLFSKLLNYEDLKKLSEDELVSFIIYLKMRAINDTSHRLEIKFFIYISERELAYKTELKYKNELETNKNEKIKEDECIIS